MHPVTTECINYKAINEDNNRYDIIAMLTAWHFLKGVIKMYAKWRKAEKNILNLKKCGKQSKAKKFGKN